jgi:hypothetical protein
MMNKDAPWVGLRSILTEVTGSSWRSLRDKRFVFDDPDSNLVVETYINSGPVPPVSSSLHVIVFTDYDYETGQAMAVSRFGIDDLVTSDDWQFQSSLRGANRSCLRESFSSWLLSNTSASLSRSASLAAAATLAEVKSQTSDRHREAAYLFVQNWVEDPDYRRVVLGLLERGVVPLGEVLSTAGDILTRSAS